MLVQLEEISKIGQSLLGCRKVGKEEMSEEEGRKGEGANKIDKRKACLAAE